MSMSGMRKKNQIYFHQKRPKDCVKDKWNNNPKNSIIKSMLKNDTSHGYPMKYQKTKYIFLLSILLIIITLFAICKIFTN